MAVAAAAEAITKMTLTDIEHRNRVFDALWATHKADLETIEKPEIDITLSVNGKETSLTGQAWQTTPGSLLRHLDAADKSSLGDIVVAKIDGKTLWDLDRPLESSCTISYVPFSNPEGRNVFWHSSAHVLGEACECHYPKCLLSHGPPVEQGFFYDMSIAEGQAVKEADWKPLKDAATKIIKEKQPFERLHVSLKDLEEMFSYSKYKMHYIKNLLPPEGSTVYRCGTLVDLCLGPHIQNTNKIKAFEIMKNSSCYFLGDKDGDTLQRIYGVAFP
jgi:threonyl-tRNA synthetase